MPQQVQSGSKTKSLIKGISLMFLGIILGMMVFLFQDFRAIKKSAERVYSSTVVDKDLFELLNDANYQQVVATSFVKAITLKCSGKEFKLMNIPEREVIKAEALQRGDCSSVTYIMMKSSFRKYLFRLQLDKNLKIVTKDQLVSLD